MKRFAAFDIDGTIFRSSLFIELVNQSVEQGMIPESILHDDIVAAKTAWLKRSRPDAYDIYLNNLVDSYRAHIAGVKVEDMRKVGTKVIEEMHQYTYVYTRDRLLEYKNNGYTLVAITGSPEAVANEFAKRYDFDIVVATKNIDIDGIYTGEEISGSTDKRAALQKIINDYELTTDGSVAIGDSGSDIAMLELVENPIAFNPDRILMKHAKSKGWTVVVERKNMIYKLEHDGQRYILAETGN